MISVCFKYKKKIICLLVLILMVACARTNASQQNVFTGVGKGMLPDVLSDMRTSPSIQTRIGYSSSEGWRISELLSLGLFSNRDKSNLHVTDSRDRFENDEQYMRACWFAIRKANQQLKQHNDNFKMILKQHVTMIEALGYKQDRLNTLSIKKNKEHDTLTSLIAQQDVNRQEVLTQIDKYTTSQSEVIRVSFRTKDLLTQEIQVLKQAAEELEIQIWDLRSLQQLLRTADYPSISVFAHPQE